MVEDHTGEVRRLLVEDFGKAFGLYPYEARRMASGVPARILQQAVYESYTRRVELGLKQRDDLPGEDVNEILERFGLWA